MPDRFVVWHIPKGHPKNVGVSDKTEVDEIVVVQGTRCAPVAVHTPAWYCSGSAQCPAGVKSSKIYRVDAMERDRLLKQYRIGHFDTVEEAVSFGKAEAGHRGFVYQEKVFMDGEKNK